MHLSFTIVNNNNNNSSSDSRIAVSSPCGSPHCVNEVYVHIFRRGNFAWCGDSLHLVPHFKMAPRPDLTAFEN